MSKVKPLIMKDLLDLAMGINAVLIQTRDLAIHETDLNQKLDLTSLAEKIKDLHITACEILECSYGGDDE